MARQTSAEYRHAAAVLAGRQNHAAGKLWEDMIGASCQYYQLKGIANIEKTPEAMRQLGPKNRQGQFTACYTKMAQPDYKGTLKGGRAVVFEAKHTETDRLSRDVISSEQEKQLDRHSDLGADCFVMVSFGFRDFFKIPWTVFRDMKQVYGRKYITAGDVQQYRVRYMGGVLHFLGTED